MRILVSSARGANGNGYGAILGFGPDGEFTGPFGSDPRVADPRGLSVDPSGALIYVNSGNDRVLTPHLVTDPELSPLDLKLAPDGNLVVASEWPFGAPHAVPSVREYDPAAHPRLGTRTLRGIPQPAGTEVRAGRSPVLRGRERCGGL
jgi:hypothetical protein